jgi:hypothetical protein
MVANRRFGSKAVNLKVSICFPLLPRKRTFVIAHPWPAMPPAPRNPVRSARIAVALDQVADHHVLCGRVRDGSHLPIGVRLRLGLDEHAELPDHLRAEAAALVDDSWSAIERVAGALAGGGMLAEADVDRLIAKAAFDFEIKTRA